MLVQAFQHMLTMCLKHMQTKLELEAKRRNLSVRIHEALLMIDMIIKFKVKMITSPPFGKQLRLGDLTMAEFQVTR